MKTSVTSAGMKRMEEELSRLKGPVMREHLQALAEAREKGDISENAEYEVARDNINMLNIKISNLESKIKGSSIVYKEKVSCEEVQLFTKVTILNTKTQKVVTYSIVTEDDAEPKAMKISVASPLSQGLMGHKKGDFVKVGVPSGLLELQVIDISAAD
jgi:transcription elongation factor GreA